jgi:pimeloyl-ACP methyl ester carboxylesterase
LERTHKGKVGAIWGELDTVIPTILVQDLKALVPSLWYKTIPNCSHSVVFEYVEATVEQINLFFEKC